MDAPLPPQDFKREKPMEGFMITNLSHQKEAITSSYVENKVIIKEAPKDLPPKALNCPRCNSSNTKFCYYNNYSQTQPRYFCKACKRYWTQGGSLRNIPVGGKIRKNKRQQSSSSTSYSLLSNATKIKLPTDLFDSSTNPNPPNNNGPYDHQFKNSYSFSAPYQLSPMEIGASSRGSVMASFMPIMQMSDSNQNLNLNSNPDYPLGFSFQGDLRSNLGFSLDDFGRVDHNKVSDHDVHQDHSIGDQHHQHGDSTGFWNGNINLGGGAGSW